MQPSLWGLPLTSKTFILNSFLIIQTVDPSNDFLLCVLDVVPGDCQTVQHLCTRLQSLNGGRRPGKAAAAVSAEWNHRLAAEIVGVEEGVENLRQVTPPNGITNIVKGLHMCYTSK